MVVVHNGIFSYLKRWYYRPKIAISNSFKQTFFHDIFMRTYIFHAKYVYVFMNMSWKKSNFDDSNEKYWVWVWCKGQFFFRFQHFLWDKKRLTWDNLPHILDNIGVICDTKKSTSRSIWIKFGINIEVENWQM